MVKPSEISDKPGRFVPPNNNSVATQDTRSQSGQIGDNDIEREIRFAVVIYGGVSLTIYINGIAQEMLHLVRSTTDDPGELSRLLRRSIASSQPLVGEPAHVSLRAYQVHRNHSEIDPAKAGLVAALEAWFEKNSHSRFIVDILSGTSAGGINAIYLAKALGQ